MAPNVWLFRWPEENPNDRRIYRKRVIGTLLEYGDEAAVRQASAGILSELNNMRSSHDRIGFITVNQLCEHFEQREIRASPVFGASQRSRVIADISVVGFNRVGVPIP